MREAGAVPAGTGRTDGVPPVRAVIFDAGDVLIHPAHALLDRLEAATGLRFSGRGPLGTEPDPRWEAMERGELSWEQYWHGVGAEAGTPTLKELHCLVSRTLPDEMWDPQMIALVHECRAAGCKVAVLTNDMVNISGPDFRRINPTMQIFDAVVDSADVGVRKPAPKPYLAICAALGVDPGECVFLDDTPACVEGAAGVGMQGVLVDTFDRAPAIAHVRQLVGRGRR